MQYCRRIFLNRIPFGFQFYKITQMKSKYNKIYLLLLSIAVLAIICPLELSSQEVHNYMPTNIGWHKAVYNENKREPKLVPRTSWDNAIEREMNWYIKAPVNDHGYPSYVYITFMDENYQPYRNDFLPATQNGMGINH